MRQSDKEELLYGNTGRKRLLTLKKTQEIFENFSKIFKLFLGSRKGVMGTDINLKVDSKIISNQETVVEIFADHFETVNMLFAGWEVHMMKNCDRVLENSMAEGSISRPRSQFFTIWTDP